MTASTTALTSAPTTGIAIQGAATAEEVAAVVAALHPRPPGGDSNYERWRRARLSAQAEHHRGTGDRGAR